MNRLGATIAIILTAIGLVLGGASPAGAQVKAPAGDSLSPEIGDMEQSPIRPVVTWRMPERFGLVPKTFDDVNPRSWKIEVDTCKSHTRKGKVTGIQWQLFAPDGAAIVSTRTCRRTVTLPSLDTYRLKVTVTTTKSKRVVEQRVEPKDHIIVVAGDSMASGEGNPDVRGRAKLELCGDTIDVETAVGEFRWLSPECILDLGSILTGTVPRIVSGTPSTWKLDPDCHRSYRSGMSLAARDIERRDPHSSVTYINVACSGAEVKHLFDEPYDGVYTDGPWDTGKKDPQADQIARLVCGRVGSCDDERVRPVDGIFLSIGINNLSMSDVLTDCMKPDFKQVLGVDGCMDSSFDTVEEGLAGMQLAKGMGDRLEALGVPVKSVYHAVYPTYVFTSTSTGCGAFRFINDGEKEWLQDANMKLNQNVYQAYTPHYHWRPVWRQDSATSSPWKGHGYCMGDKRWFVSLFDSLVQYNGLGKKIANGAVHPNSAGHDQFRKEFLNEWDQRTRPVTDRVVVTIEGVKVTSVQAAHNGWTTFVAGRRGSDGATRFGVKAALEVPDQIDVRRGQWVDLRSRNMKLSLGLNKDEQLRVSFYSANNMPPERDECPDPAEPPTQVRRAIDDDSTSSGNTVACIRPIVRGFTIDKRFTKADSWGATGSRTATDESGNFKIRYRISRIPCKLCPPLDGIPRMEMERG